MQLCVFVCLHVEPFSRLVGYAGSRIKIGCLAACDDDIELHVLGYRLTY